MGRDVIARPRLFCSQCASDQAMIGLSYGRCLASIATLFAETVNLAVDKDRSGRWVILAVYRVMIWFQ